MVVSSKFNPLDTGVANFACEVLLVVKSIAFDSVGKSSFGYRLEHSDRIESSSSRRMNGGFSEAEGVFAVVFLMLVFFKCSKNEK